MPIFFLVVGIMLIVVGINNKLPELGSLIKEDFAPSQAGVTPFQIWIIAIFAIGAIGYYKPAKPLSNSFLALVVLVMVLSNKGFFKNFSTAFNIKV